MKRIVRKSAERLSVAEARRLILDALPVEGGVDIFVRLKEDGSVDLDGPVRMERNPDAKRGAAFIDEDMLEVFGQLGIRPRWLHRPAITDFESGSDPEQYTISHDELVALADAYDVHVELDARGAHAEGDVGTPTRQDAPKGPLLKRRALVHKYCRDWPTIEADLHSASENGLSEAAKSDRRGYWHEDAALQWARERAKYGLKAVAKPELDSIMHRMAR